MSAITLGFASILGLPVHVLQHLLVSTALWLDSDHLQKKKGELRYKNLSNAYGSDVGNLPSGLPTLEEEGSVLQIELNHDDSTVTFRAPESWRTHLGVIHIQPEDRNKPLHLYAYLVKGSVWQIVETWHSQDFHRHQ